MSVLALVPAAGDDVQQDVGMPEVMLPVGGIPLVVRAVQGLLSSGVVDHVLVLARQADLATICSLFAATPAVEVITGGTDRISSVGGALRYGERRFPSARIVLVHDAARALTPPALVCSVVSAVAGGVDAVVPVLPVADTVKDVDSRGAVRGTVDRSALRTVQTPRAFRLSLLRRAYQEATGSDVIDEMGLVERLGEQVHTVPGDPLAFKISTPWDLRVAELMVKS